MELFRIVGFLLVFLVIRANCLIPPKPSHSVSEYHSRFKERAVVRLQSVEKTGRVFYLSEYGADPTGKDDSRDAIMRAINDAFQVESDLELLAGIKDLGGVQIDLQGGNYLISKPLRFPSTGGGNLATGRVFYLSEYGADPTGKNDSSDAIMSAINDAFQVEGDLELLEGIKDLGGVQIDLQGGNYLISKPLRFPSTGGGNLAIHSGTLRASEDFPTNRSLIELWSENSPRLPQNASITAADYEASKQRVDQEGDYYYEDITIRDLALDSSYRGSGILTVDSVRTKIINCFIFHFGKDGILVEGGHQTYISTTFIGQHINVGGDPGEKNFSGTGINLAGNNNAITDVVIFSAATGVMIRRPANILTGVHCYNKATDHGGVGIYVNVSMSPRWAQTRIDNSYLDWNGIVAVDPVQLHITNCFFLGDGNIVIKSENGRISGLNIVDNMFSGNDNGVPIVVLDETNGPFNNVGQVVIDRNNVMSMAYRSTVGKVTVAGKGTKWMGDFSNVLIFPNRITHVQYSMVVRGNSSFSLHGVTSVCNNNVVVESAEVVDGVVSVLVDQDLVLGEKSMLVCGFEG